MNTPPRKFLFLPLLLLLAGMLLAIPMAMAQGPDDASQPVRVQNPDAIDRGIAPYPGIYIFLDNSAASPDDYPFLTGGNMTFRWRNIELSDQYFDWTEVEEWLDAEASAGKAANIGFSVYDGRCCGGSAIPPWMIQENEESVVRCDDMNWAIPRYWSPYFLKQYREFIQAFAQRYDNDPRIAWIEIGTGIYGEANPGDSSDHGCLLDAGLTSQLWVETSMDIMDIFADAFQNTPLLYQYAPVYVPEGQGSIAQRRVLTDYAASLGIGVKNNGLSPDMDFALVDNPDKSYYKAGIWDPIYTLWPRVPVGWESYASQKCVDPQPPHEQSAGITMWCVYAGLAGHADYFVFSQDLVTDPGRAPYLEFAQHYLGAEVSTTDSVWVALRETEFNFYPARGNFSFWLTQNDAVSGGKTAPEWNVTAAKEGRYTRRTDRKSGNINMYFDVDNAWMYRNENAAVTIEVIYLDKGNDTWSLYYDAVDDAEKLAGTVQKTNSWQWLTQTFTLTDAFFSDRLPGGGDHPGSDFYLASNDFDDAFHRVRVFRDDVAPTPTPPPIITPMPTPTPGPDAPTPTPEPIKMVLRQGYQGYSGVDDTWIGTWCAGYGETDGDRNHGGEQTLAVRVNNAIPNQSICNALIRFDVSRVPAGSKIIEAKLVLKGVESGDVARINLNAFDLYQPWDEYQATWFQARDGSVWDAPGADGPGDHPQLPLDTGFLVGNAASEHSAWTGIDVTPLVQRWIANPDSNYGVLLRPFFHKNIEWLIAASEYPVEHFRPKLEIRYYSPDYIPPTATPTATPAPTATPIPNTGVVQGVAYHDLLGGGEPAYNPGIPDVQLTLTSQERDETITVTTDHRGHYRMANIQPGLYLLKETQPIGWTKAQPADSILVTIASDQTYTFNFGHQPLSQRFWMPMVYQQSP